MARIRPTKGLDAQVRTPGSKSYTLRGMVTGVLAQGKTVLANALLCQDTQVMTKALTLLGAKVKYQEGAFYIEGCEGTIKNPQRPLEMGNSGASLRFLTALVALGEGRYIITGDERMRERPIQDLLDALGDWGVRGHTLYQDGFPPLLIETGGIKGGRTRLSGERSSQFLSALLLVAPYAQAEVEIEVLEKLVSRPYVDLTLDVMETFGVRVQRDGYRRFKVSPEGGYRGREYPIEGDWSSASYFFAAAAITQGRVKVYGLSPHSFQGDQGFLQILQEMGCGVEVGDEWVEVKGERLQGLEVQMGDMPDLVPTLAVIASFAQGETIIRGVPHLRVKESDRIKTLANELCKVGVKVKEMEDGLAIEGGRPHAGRIESRRDHRIAMAFGVMGLAIPGIEIEGQDCVGKSYPSFWEELERIAG
ncbi:MAG: 3-phosphoshikimate 1-carboxyvinyltransferase [Deltaproteobacteria bacterium]|nr:3-phosphoshikimate 1-carboxyvinyltransferase [Deltaproteobacteria bacterium]